MHVYVLVARYLDVYQSVVFSTKEKAEEFLNDGNSRWYVGCVEIDLDVPTAIKPPSLRIDFPTEVWDRETREWRCPTEISPEHRSYVPEFSYDDMPVPDLKYTKVEMYS